MLQNLKRRTSPPRRAGRLSDGKSSGCCVNSVDRIIQPPVFYYLGEHVHARMDVPVLLICFLSSMRKSAYPFVAPILLIY